MSDTTYTGMGNGSSSLSRQEITIGSPQAVTNAWLQVGTTTFLADGRSIVFLRINWTANDSTDVDFRVVDGSGGVKFNKEVNLTYTDNAAGPNRIPDEDIIGYLEIDVSGMDGFIIEMKAGTVGATAGILNTARLILP